MLKRKEVNMKQNRNDIISSHDEFEDFKKEFNLQNDHIDYIINDDVIKVNTYEVSDEVLDIIENNISNVELFYSKC
jgi:hypothetical protein|tara:strand:+ start:957 stop:1184 length:228 start_codon:yes stop_codon:yes gene_type:complete